MIEKYDYYPSGQLSLNIRRPKYLGVRQQFNDGKKQRIEDCLGIFIETLKAAAQAIKEKRRQDEERRIEWEEQRRQYEELRQLEMLENSKTEKLNKDVENWIKAINIRNYTVALRENVVNLSGLDEWAEWCTRYADKIDPFKNRENLIFPDNSLLNFNDL